MSKPTGPRLDSQSSHKPPRKPKPKNEKTPLSTAQPASTRTQPRQPTHKQETVSKNLLQEFNRAQLPAPSPQPVAQVQVQEEQYYQPLPQSYILAMKALQNAVQQAEDRNRTLSNTVEQLEGELVKSQQEVSKVREEKQALESQLANAVKQSSRAKESEAKAQRERGKAELQKERAQKEKLMAEKQIQQVLNQKEKVERQMQKAEMMRDKAESERQKSQSKREEMTQQHQEITKSNRAIQQKCDNLQAELAQIKSQMKKEFKLREKTQSQQQEQQNREQNKQRIREKQQPSAQLSTGKNKHSLKAVWSEPYAQDKQEEEVLILREQVKILGEKLVHEREQTRTTTPLQAQSIHQPTAVPVQEESPVKPKRSRSVYSVHSHAPHHTPSTEAKQARKSILFGQEGSKRAVVSQMREMMRVEKELVALNYQMEVLEKSMTGGRSTPEAQRTYCRLRREIEKREMELGELRRSVEG